MTHWHKLFEQLLQTTLFLPKTLRHTPTSPSSSPEVCSLCQQPHAPAAPSDAHQPAADDQEGWKQYWTNKGQPWRTKPEISPRRQQELTQRRTIVPNIKRGIYPFKGMKLSRADVEWLLATHGNGHGPVDWKDESQRERDGLDLRGADICNVDLSYLPLTRLHAGLTFSEGRQSGSKTYRMAALLANGTNFFHAQLQGAVLAEAQLREAVFLMAQLEDADLQWAQLQKATLQQAHLESADLRHAQLEDADLQHLHLEGADLKWAGLQAAYLPYARLQRADLREAKLQGANLSHAELTGTNLSEAQLTGAILRSAKLEGVAFSGANLIDQRHVGPCAVDVSWAGTNLSVVPWSQMLMLSDEDRARHTHDADGRKKDRVTRLREFQEAMRATHQLSVALQDQGLTTDASRFAYRAKYLERIIRWYELHTVTWRDPNTKKRTAKSVWQGLTRFFSILVSWLFSWFLFLIAGYGYRLRYCLGWYLLIVGGCTVGYLLLEPHQFTWLTAFAESVNVFHGRGASPSLSSLTHPARFAALTIAEAWAGLVLEVVLVATLLQRFFGK